MRALVAKYRTARDKFLAEKSDFSQFLQADVWNGTALSFEN
jgi:hypothetical protein